MKELPSDSLTAAGISTVLVAVILNEEWLEEKGWGGDGRREEGGRGGRGGGRKGGREGMGGVREEGGRREKTVC